MAEVYKAYHPGLDRYVAIKVLHSFLAEEKDFLTRFQREARIVATFRHPNIVQVYDFDYDADNNAYYMVMEFIDGPSLKSRLKEVAREGQMLPLEEAVRIVVAVANALDYAHQHGMVHRDIKPANIMFTQDGQVILSDFGIARMVDTATLTASGAMVGTPAYMAPEQGLGQTGDERSDIYSLGVVLYQLITGSLPFDADTPLGIVLKHINAPPAPPTDLNSILPPGVEAVVMRALAKDPNNRYQTAREFAADLEKAMAGKPIEPFLPVPAPASDTATTSPYETKLGTWPTLSGTTTAPPLQATSAIRPRRRWIPALVVALALVLLSGLVLITTGTSDHLFAALFPQPGTLTPGVTGISTPTPDLAATYDVLATQVAAGVGAALATRDALATYEATINASPTPTPTPTSTPTPDLTATALTACVFDMEVVSDQAVWPSILMPGQRFTKRWEIQNTGTCTWPDDVRLTFTSGFELDVVTEPEIEPLPPDETAEVVITLRAPTDYDRYTSVWELQYGEESSIGEELEITCRVGPTPTPRPTATPTATPTPELSPTPMEPLRIDSTGIVPGTYRQSGDGNWEADIYVVARGGDGNYRFYRDVISPDTEFFAPNPDEPWVGVYHGARWQVCKSMWISFWVTSAGMEAHWDIPIPYPGTCQ